MTRYSRRSFLTTAGAATGLAAVSASPIAAAVGEPDAIETVPSGAVPPESVVAIVRDASLGEVTVMSGETETTYNDAWLVKRLLKASRSQNPSRSKGVA